MQLFLTLLIFLHTWKLRLELEAALKQQLLLRLEKEQSQQTDYST